MKQAPDCPTPEEELTTPALDSIRRFEMMFPGLKISVNHCQLATAEDVNLTLYATHKDYLMMDEGEGDG